MQHLNVALFILSGRQDSNLRPPGPKPGALPIAPRPENGFKSTKKSSILNNTTRQKHYRFLLLSGRQDSNLRPPGPKPGALPIAPRPENFKHIRTSLFLTSVQI